MKSLAILTATLLTANIASAQSEPSRVQEHQVGPETHIVTVPSFDQQSDTPTRAPRNGKNKFVAFSLAAASTAAGFGVAYAADEAEKGGGPAGDILWGGALALLTVGPASGHIYAGEYGHAAITTLGRSVGMAIYAAGIVPAFFGGDSDTTYVLLGAGTFISLTAYDLFDAPRAAGRANASQIALTPMISHDGSPNGVSLVGQF